MTAAIDFRHVAKRYRYFALDDLSFRLEHGQIMGFVGPNGAGKSTSIRILMGLVGHDAGDVQVLGHAMPQAQVRAKQDIGYVADDMRLFGAATLEWHMRFVRSVHAGWDEGYARALLKRFHLHAQQPVKGLSSGERAKAVLLLALARRPRLLVLDEPTAGLDPVARHEVLAELTDVLRDDDRSILFSSHNTLDVEQICDRITFIDRGRLVASDDKDVFLDRWRRVHLDLAPERLLPVLPGMVDTVRSGHVAVVTVNAWSDDLPAACAQSGVAVREVQRMTLEEVFVANVMHNRREREA